MILAKPVTNNTGWSSFLRRQNWMKLTLSNSGAWSLGVRLCRGDADASGKTLAGV